jgi:hypothetical protein
MCELCVEDKESVKTGLEMRAEQLERMAAMMRSVANGRIKPHTQECSEIIVPLAKLLIRFLVEDWL